MITVTYEQVADTLRTLGYPVWVKPYDLNLFGVRNPSTRPDPFDDTIGVGYTDGEGRRRIIIAPATTDPGLDYLLSPMNPKGTAIMVEGYYRKLWAPGKHRGYNALVQISPAVYVRQPPPPRGTPVDKVALNFDGLKRETAIIASNLHRAHETLDLTKVGKYSAGCQVMQSVRDLQYILALVAMQVKYVRTGNVSYALMNERNF